MAQICHKNSILHNQISIFHILHAGDNQSLHNERYLKNTTDIMVLQRKTNSGLESLTHNHINGHSYNNFL